MANKEVAIGKRLQITQTNKNIFATVAITSIVVGFALVGVIYCVKMINFNIKVISAKDDALTVYAENDRTIKVLNEEVLALQTNQDLESVARERASRCLNVDGSLIDTSTNIELMRECTALRVIPDAIPSVYNPTALGVSLTELLTYENIMPESSSVGDNSSIGTVGRNGVSAIDAAFSVMANGQTIRGLLDRLERSIRPIDIRTAGFEWKGTDLILMSIQSNAYYTTEVKAEKKTRIIKAGDN